MPNNQSVTRTSDDSIRQYISAPGSPFLIQSSFSVSNNMDNKQQDDESFNISSSPLTTSSFTTGQVLTELKDNTPTPSLLHNRQPSFVTATSFDTTMEDPNPNGLSQGKIASPRTVNLIKEPTPINHTNEISSSHTNKREKTPIRHNNNNDTNSSSPHLQPIKQTKVTRPTTSSSASSSATVGFTVTPLSQNRTDKVPGNQNIEPTPFVSSQNNNNNVMLENASRNHSLAISDIQHNLRKMALNQDLEELKKTVDRMEKERISDREEHLNRVKEQKLRETEILEQIKITKERLELAIAGKLFLGPKKPFTGNTIEEEYNISSEPIMKTSVSSSSIRTKPNKASSNEFPRQQVDVRQQEGNRNTRGSRKQYPQQQQAGNRSESYFPDISQIDYMNHNQPFFPAIPNNNSRSYQHHLENEFINDVNRYELFDSPTSRRNSRTNAQQRRQRSKSMESSWLPAHELIDVQPQHKPQHQQQSELNYDDPTIPIDGYRPRNRSRKSSSHSTKSNPLDVASVRNNHSSHDLQSGYHSAAEEEGDCIEDIEKENNREQLQQQQQRAQFQNEDPRLHGRYRRRSQLPPPPPNGMHPSMMYPGFGGPLPPHMSHMGIPNDNRDRLGKIRPPPPFVGYNNGIPPTNDYYPYHPQRMSPRMMAATFTDDSQWNNRRSQQQWGNQKMYGMPPPAQPENNGNPAVGNNISNANNTNNAVNHLQEENNFTRRYPLAQQTPQKSQQHGYMSMYGEPPHILYI